MYRKYIKRLLDIIISIILIIILFPLFIIIGIISKISVGNVIYKQNRDGLNKISFTIYKFKSMTDDKKIPKIMVFIRSFGLDELPQLFNILKGDMSFIGPRPLITGEKIPFTDPIIYTVKPGLISLAVANGRRKISHEKRVEYDVIYVNDLSFKLDIIIIFKTIIVLLKQNIRGD